MANILPPPPINDAPGSFTWLEWYRQLRTYVSTTGSVPWYIINFAGSNITDIVSRNHGNLQGLQGGSAGEHYHLTAAQAASIGAGAHNNLTGIQGGSTTQRYHVNADQYAAISNSLEVLSTTSGTTLPIVPTVFIPTSTVVITNGITYDTATGITTFVNGGSYNLEILLNASASAGNRKIYFYAEVDTGSGFAIRQYSARSHEIVPSIEDQITFATTNYFAKGTRVRHVIWASNATITLNTTNVPGTTAGTVTIPSFRMLWSGSL